MSSTELTVEFTDATAILLITYHFLMIWLAPKLAKLIEKGCKIVYNKIRNRPIGFK